MFRDDSYKELKVSKKDDILSLLGPSNVTIIGTIRSDELQKHLNKIEQITVYADDEKFNRVVGIHSKFNSDSEYYLCKVEGDDLKDSNIDKNSDIIIKRQNYALNGQIVLVYYNDEYLFKKFYKNKNLIYLMSGKNNVNRIDVSDEYFEIIGVVVEVISKIKGRKSKY